MINTFRFLFVVTPVTFYSFKEREQLLRQVHRSTHNFEGKIREELKDFDLPEGFARLLSMLEQEVPFGFTEEDFDEAHKALKKLIVENPKLLERYRAVHKEIFGSILE